MNPRRCVGVLALLGLASCTQSVEVAAPLIVAESSLVPRCLDEAESMGLAASDRVVVDVFTYEGASFEPTEAGAPACARCFDGSARCERVVRRCACGSPIGDLDDLESYYRALRLDDLPPETPVCLRLVAGSGGGPRGEDAPDAPPRDCTAEPACADVDPLATTASLCVFGEPLIVNRSASVVPDALATVSCRLLDEPARQCRGRDCSCPLDDPAPGLGYTRCLLASNASDPLCQSGCGLAVAQRCYQLHPACTLALVGAATVAECAGF